MAGLGGFGEMCTHRGTLSAGRSLCPEPPTELVPDILEYRNNVSREVRGKGDGREKSHVLTFRGLVGKSASHPTLSLQLHREEEPLKATELTEGGTEGHLGVRGEETGLRSLPALAWPRVAHCAFG